MQARGAAVAATLALLAMVLSGCGSEEPQEAPVPCLGGCYTEAPSEASGSTASPSPPGDNHDMTTARPGRAGEGHSDNSDNSGNSGTSGQSGGNAGQVGDNNDQGGNHGGGSQGGGQDGDQGGDQGGNQGGGDSQDGNGDNGPTPSPPQLRETMPAVRKCYLEPLYPGAGCQLLEQLVGGEFGLNFYGMETTAKRECMDRLRAAGGNTFLSGLGQCELWNCSSAAALRSSSGPQQSADGTVSFGTWKDTLVSVQPDGNLQGLLQQVEAPAMPPPIARFLLQSQPGGEVALKSIYADRYVSALAGGALSAAAATVGDSEKFELVQNSDNTVSLRAPTGQYVSVRDSGSVLAVAGSIDGWEKLVLLNNTSPQVQLPPTNRVADMQVYSELCQYEEMTGGLAGEVPRSPVFVKLWEWNFVDVAKECTDYLGPNGVDAVQVSPVLEHIQGPEWWTKYKPVSYGLDSRSGTRQEFTDMVATCRRAGVEVIVDVILNHLADPCSEARGSSGTQTPCVGWNGTNYGNRRSLGARGWDAVDPTYFHHLPGRLYDNCGVGADTGFLCGGVDLRDCSCCSCDLYGLPDFDTGLDKVREIQLRHIFELHDIGVTMARIDASLYESPDDLSAVLHRVPWDCIYQEWYGELPVEARTREVGLYRDVSYRWKISNRLSMLEPERLPEILQLDQGVNGITNDMAVYPIAYHDGRTNEATPDELTYKMGLAYHQSQKFLLAWPKSSTVLLWGGFGWSNIEQGPPGCEEGALCTPLSIFNAQQEPQCMATPTQSPLPEPAQTEHSWVCEHRWHGVAGLVNFRKACRGLEVSHTWAEGSAGDTSVARGRLAYRLGQDCFVALVRGHHAEQDTVFGDWDLATLDTGLPAGRYCDLASLPTQNGWDRTSCPREVTIGENGVVQEGAVKDGDLLAIHTGERLTERRRLRASGGRTAGSA